MHIRESSDFDTFLTSLRNEAKVNIIRQALIDLSEGKVELDQRECDHFENRTKVAIPEADVVVFFDTEGDTMTMINGCTYYHRVA